MPAQPSPQLGFAKPPCMRARTSCLQFPWDRDGRTCSRWRAALSLIDQLGSSIASFFFQDMGHATTRRWRGRYFSSLLSECRTKSQGSNDVDHAEECLICTLVDNESSAHISFDLGDPLSWTSFNERVDPLYRHTGYQHSRRNRFLRVHCGQPGKCTSDEIFVIGTDNGYAFPSLDLLG
jgi:hypothetical protein